MHEATRCQGADQSTGGCHKKYRTEVFGGDCGKSALLWAPTGKIIHGYESLVCTKVGRDRNLYRDYEADDGLRDFADVEILKVGGWPTL